MVNLSGKTAVVVGASRGLGQAVAKALARSGASVITVARSKGAEPIENVQVEVADASEATVPTRILGQFDPDIVILVAGAVPSMRPLQEQTWESFEVNWQSDVRIAFHWLREILLKPLKPGSRVVVFSSGAAVGGSPLSGGYAGAKATQRFITAYAQTEAKRAGLDITFSSVLPFFSPKTGVGSPAVNAYAVRSGLSVDDFLASIVRTNGSTVSPEGAGDAIVELVTKSASEVSPSYMLNGTGLKALLS